MTIRNRNDGLIVRRKCTYCTSATDVVVVTMQLVLLVLSVLILPALIVLIVSALADCTSYLIVLVGCTNRNCMLLM